MKEKIAIRAKKMVYTTSYGTFYRQQQGKHITQPFKLKGVQKVYVPGTLSKKVYVDAISTNTVIKEIEQREENAARLLGKIIYYKGIKNE